MRPKPPSRPTLPRGSTPGDSLAQSPRLRPQVPDPLLPHSLPDLTTWHLRNSADTQPPAGTPELPKIEVSDLPVVSRETATGLDSYRLNPGLLRNLQPPNEDGLRHIVGRTFVDVKDAGTVHVEFDAKLGTYRAMDQYKKLPPGPALYRNTGESTWSPARQADSHTSSKRPFSQVDPLDTQRPFKRLVIAALTPQEATTRLLNAGFPRTNSKR